MTSLSMTLDENLEWMEEYGSILNMFKQIVKTFTVNTKTSLLPSKT